ncbi:MAG: cytochrome oxidase biosynthesis protein [Cycloclasticus sp.]|nr:MAG: cytochrome oxidase biosynthesis protein [Cycloclasticus sp.]
MQFKANLFLTVLAILVLGLLLSLGFWQLDRAQQKQDLLDLQSSRMSLPAVELINITVSDNNMRYLPVRVAGELDVAQQILIDNQVRHGIAGYSVLTPLRINSKKAILLNRGWLPLGGDRNVLPDVTVQASNVQVSGKLDHFPTVGLKLDKADELSAGWPAITQVVDTDKVSKRLGYQVMPYQLLLNADEAEGYNRDWVVMRMGPEKHHGYAFQWFALATSWVIIYFVLTVKRRCEEE